MIEVDLGGYENSCEHELQCRKLIHICLKKKFKSSKISRNEILPQKRKLISLELFCAHKVLSNKTNN